MEFFESAAIAYAIYRAGYPREALSALILGHILVFSIAFLIAPLYELFPIFWMRLVAAILLTLMGLNWTVKSLIRIIKHKRPRWAEDPLGKVHVSPAKSSVVKFSPFVFFVMGKSSVIEAGEILLVVFPVAAATAAWKEVILGVVSGITAVSLLVVALHGQLKNIPEVKLKLGIGLLLTLMGISWLIEIFIESN